MKIKKKHYEKALRDEYWRGVDAGIKFALKDPDMARKYNGAQLRAQVEVINGALAKLGEQLAKVFNGGK